MIRLSIDNPELDYPILLPFIRRWALTVERILGEIECVLQSYEQFVIVETFGIDLVHVHAVSGSGCKSNFIDITKMMETKRSDIRIRNDDELCCAQAIVTAIARMENDPKWESIRKGLKIPKEGAVHLHKRAGVPLGECGTEEVKKFQDILPEYQINVLSKEHFNDITYSGPAGGKPIYLYCHDKHYDVITSMTGFLNRSYFRTMCKKGYQHKERHARNNPCNFCHQLHTDTREDWTYCRDCNCNFVNETCFNLHLKRTENGKSTCDVYYRCQLCNQLINRSKHKESHVCGETYCQTCKGCFSDGHQCYMQPVDEEDCKTDKSKKALTYLFFDLECTQESLLQCQEGNLPGVNNTCVNCKKTWCGTLEHRPNLCVVHKVRTACMNTNVTSSTKCCNCGLNEMVFSGTDTITAFCKWLFSGVNNVKIHVHQSTTAEDSVY